MSDLIQIQIQDHTTRLTLCRPEKGNSLSSGMVDALTATVERCQSDGTRLLVLEAQGRNFCTGFDLGNLDEQTDDALLARFIRIELLLQALQAAPFLTVAIGHGRHIGAGADLFVACQRRVVVGEASFRFPGAAFGLVLGTGRLARLVGAAHACEWVGSGREVTRNEGLARGLITQVLDEPMAETLIDQFARESLRLDSATQHAVYAASGHSQRSADDLMALVRSAARPGLRERIQAFRGAPIKG